MPNYTEKQWQRDLAELERIRNRPAASGGGGGKGSIGNSAESNTAPSWNCQECGYFNFGSRRRCRKCPTAHPLISASATNSPQPGGKGAGGGGGKGGGKAGGKNREGKNAGSGRNGGEYAKLLAQCKALEEQNKMLTLKAAEAAKGNEGDEEDPELLEDDADDDPQATVDLENLQALQKLYDSTLVTLGAEDPSAKALRQRLDAARAKQRAAKPVLQQVQAAQRKAARQEKHLESAKGRLAELEQQRKELDKEIAEQTAKVAACAEEVDRCRTELGELLERAKAEQGTATQTPPAGAANSGSPSASGGLQGAAAAWNQAKSAIQAQLATLPSDAAAELRQAIAAQYAAMEAVLNKLPTSTPTVAASASSTSAPPPPASHPPGPQPTAPSQESSAQQPLPPAAAAATAAAAADGGDGRTDGAATATHGDGAGGGDDGDDAMQGIDDAAIAQLAAILTDGGGTVAGDVDDADGDGDGDDGNGSRKSRRLLDSRVAAARQFLEGKIPLRKTHFRKPGK